MARKVNLMLFFILAVLVVVFAVLLIVLLNRNNPSLSPEVLDSIKCTDSDNGLNYEVKGEVSLILSNANVKSYIDECNGNKLKEFYCLNNDPMIVEYNCENQCVDGSCR